MPYNPGHGLMCFPFCIIQFLQPQILRIMHKLPSQTKQALIEALDLGLDCTNEPEFKPRNISRDGMIQLFQSVPESVRTIARKLRDDGWRFYAVDQNRGRCYPFQKVITIPCWVIRRSIQQKTWYICHEMAHAIVLPEHPNESHGKIFMDCLISICPADCVHFELDYKPRNAAIAGIRAPGSDPDYFKLLEL